MNKLFFKINLKLLIHKLILLVLILTPLFSFQESMSLIFGGIIDNSTALTSPYIKGIKDLVFILLILISALLILKKYRININIIYLLFIFSIMIFLPAFYYHNNIIIFLSGIRWLIPFVLAVFLINNIDKELLFKIGKILFYLFILHFIFQIFQLFLSDGWFGLNSLGLSVRNPGIFFIPSTAAIFTILLLFFSKFYMDKRLEKILFIFIPISIFLTASGTGIAVYIIFMSVYSINKKYLPLLPLILIFLAVILFLSLDTLSGRSGLMEQSFGPRILVFKDIFLDGTYLANDFGYGTSTGYLIANKYGLDFDMAITDSWFATVMVNLGFVNSFIVFIGMIILFFILIMKKDHEKLIFFMIYALFSATTIFTESYPANLIFAVMSAYYLTSKKSKHETPNNSQ